MGRDRKNERPQSAGNALQSNFKSFFFPPPRDRFAFSRVKFPFHYPPRILFSRILSLPREIVQKNRQFGGLRLYIIIGRTKGETPRERWEGDEQFWKSLLRVSLSFLHSNSDSSSNIKWNFILLEWRIHKVSIFWNRSARSISLF